MTSCWIWPTSHRNITKAWSRVHNTVCRQSMPPVSSLKLLHPQEKIETLVCYSDLSCWNFSTLNPGTEAVTAKSVLCFAYAALLSLSRSLLFRYGAKIWPIGLWRQKRVKWHSEQVELSREITLDSTKLQLHLCFVTASAKRCTITQTIVLIRKSNPACGVT